MTTSARRVRVTNPNLTQSEKFILDADYSSGTVVTVKSNYGIQANDILVFESAGTEKAEAGSVASTATNVTININSALKFSHQKGTQLFRSEYDQVEISYQTAAGGSWVVLDTIGIKWDDNETIKVHQGATSLYQYRFRFKNSVSGNYSEYSSTIGGGGYAANQAGRQVTIVRKVILDPDRKKVSDEQIISFLSDAKNIIKATKNDWWFWMKEDSGTITTVASQRRYDLDDISSAIEYVKDLRFRDESGGDDILRRLKWLSHKEFDQYISDQDKDDDDNVVRYTMDPPDSSSTAGYIKVDPAPEVTGNGSFYPRYYQPDADFDDVADTTAIPLPSILADYAIAQCEKIKGSDERAAIYEKRFYGPSPQNRDRSQLTGIALLEQMQIGKLRPLKQSKAVKLYRGRRAISRLHDRVGLNQDQIAEDYFNYPIR